jgi:hypothetical protein
MGVVAYEREGVGCGENTGGEDTLGKEVDFDVGSNVSM